MLNNIQNIGNINKVKNILYPIFEYENERSEKLFSKLKNNRLEKIIAIKKVNQSDAIVVFTLLFLTYVPKNTITK